MKVAQHVLSILRKGQMMNLNLKLSAMNGHNIQLNCLNLTIIVPKVTACAKEQNQTI